MPHFSAKTKKEMAQVKFPVGAPYENVYNEFLMSDLRYCCAARISVLELHSASMRVICLGVHRILLGQNRTIDFKNNSKRDHHATDRR